MSANILYRLLTVCIAAIWLLNGLFCKVLNLVPRHQHIVANILGEEHSLTFTRVIGVAEIVMAVWVLSSYRSRLSTIIQIVVIGVMNVIEFAMVPNLLLWGRLNILFAFVLMAIIYFNEFHLKVHAVNNVLRT